jgi:prepilin-type N-terminal cleavage/methylation domain-containing protein
MPPFVATPAGRGGTIAGPTMRKAFTLIEIMVVVFIIVVLLGIIVGVSRYVSEETARKQTEATQRQVMVLVDNFQEAFGKPPADTDPPGGTYDEDASIRALMTWLQPWDNMKREFRLTAQDYAYLYPGAPADATRLKQLGTKIQSVTSQGLQQLTKSAYNPDVLQGAPLELRDGWDNAMRYERAGGMGGRPVLISAGPDEEFETEDDIRSDGR